MTTETMREAVKRAIYAKLEVSAFLPYEELADAEFAACISEEDVSHEFLDSIASDVIRTVLERLRVPSEAMLKAATTEFSPPGAALVAKGYWQAMLDAAAREVGEWIS